jgi:hypothetical protein
VAVTMCSQPEAATSEPMTEFTMSLGPGDWKPGPLPCAGDVVFLMVVKPERPVTGPAGYTALPGGRSFWKIWGDGEWLATFRAEGAFDWEVQAYAVAAGSYSLPPELMAPAAP